MADDVFGFLGDLLGLNSGDPAIDAANKNTNMLKRLKTEGMGYIDTGATDAKGYLTDNLNLGGLGENADGLYADALGINGADGGARARAAFETYNPGYQFELDQGLQALDRRNAAAGGFQSGGASLDTLDYAQGKARGGFQDWLANLNTGINRTVGANGDLASLATNTAGQKVGFAGDVASGLLGANNQRAEGEGANKAGMSDLFGKANGAFTGYGGF